MVETHPVVPILTHKHISTHVTEQRIEHVKTRMGKFLDCAPFYRMECILGIPRLRSTFYRMHRFLESVEHIYS